MITVLALLALGAPTTTSTAAAVNVRTVCRDAPPACRDATAQAILTWRERAEVCAADLDEARGQTAARTPKAIAALVPVPAEVPEPEPPSSGVSPLVAAILTGAALVAGTLVGALAL